MTKDSKIVAPGHPPGKSSPPTDGPIPAVMGEDKAGGNMDTADTGNMGPAIRELKALIGEWMRSVGPLPYEDVEIDDLTERSRAHLALLLYSEGRVLDLLLGEEGLRTLQCMLCPMEDLLEINCGDTADTLLLRDIRALLYRMMGR